MWFTSFFVEETGSGASVNKESDEVLHEPVFQKFEKRKGLARIKCNTWTTDLPEMKSLSSFNRKVKYLSCVIDALAKYAWVKSFKDKKTETVLLK